MSAPYLAAMAAYDAADAASDRYDAQIAAAVKTVREEQAVLIAIRAVCALLPEYERVAMIECADDLLCEAAVGAAFDINRGDAAVDVRDALRKNPPAPLVALATLGFEASTVTA